MSDSISHWLVSWFKQKNPDITVNSDSDIYNDLLLDSLGIVNLIMDIESHFKIHLTDKELVDSRFRTIKGLCDILQEKLN